MIQNWKWLVNNKFLDYTVCDKHKLGWFFLFFNAVVVVVTVVVSLVVEDKLNAVLVVLQ